jgi:large subunit ribosomal protein L31
MERKINPGSVLEKPLSNPGWFLTKKFDLRLLTNTIGAIFQYKIMKKDIHPKTHPVVFRDASAGKDFVVMSTMTSKETEKINGVDHYVIHVDISSASHPFFTGKQKLVDTSGRVEKFKRQMEKVAK